MKTHGYGPPKPCILICSDHLPPSDGGVEIVVEELASALAADGKRIVLFSLGSDDRSLPPKLQHPNITVEYASPIDLTNKLGLQSSVSVDAVSKLSSVLDRYDPDLIHVHNRFFFTSYLTPIISSLKSSRSIPLVVSLHVGSISDISGFSGRVAEGLERTVARQLLRTADRVIAVSEAVADHAVSIGANERRVEVIPNGVDTEKFRPEPAANNQSATVSDLLFVGRLVPNKGPDVFVKGIADVIDDRPSVTAHIVGKGPLEADLRDLVCELGIEDAVEFHGHVESMPKAMRSADLFCRPSLSEGMPLTLLEAMASRLPVVVTNIAGVPEVVEHERTGILVPSNDPRAVSRSITRLVEDPEFANTLGRAARSYVKTNHSWSTRAESVAAVYDEVRLGKEREL